ncbi:MAG: OsmC family protein, partial [Rhabdaerophilum sp.]
RFEVKTEANEEQLASLLKLTERYCVVFQTINTKPQLDVVLSNAGKAG